MVEVSRRGFGGLFAALAETAAAGPAALSKASSLSGVGVLQVGQTLSTADKEFEECATKIMGPPKPCAYTLNRRAEQVAELHLEEKDFQAWLSGQPPSYRRDDVVDTAKKMARSALDPDIASMRSLSTSVKYQMQVDRNVTRICASYATSIATNRQKQSRLKQYVQDSLGLPKFVTDLIVEENKDNTERELQRSLLQFTKPDNQGDV